MGKMIDNYSLQSEIGRGMYSTVYRATNIKNKQEVAIKMVKAEKFKHTLEDKGKLKDEKK